MSAGDAKHAIPDGADAVCADVRLTRAGAVGDRARQLVANSTSASGNLQDDVTRRSLGPSAAATRRSVRYSRGCSGAPALRTRWTLAGSSSQFTPTRYVERRARIRPPDCKSPWTTSTPASLDAKSRCPAAMARGTAVRRVCGSGSNAMEWRTNPWRGAGQAREDSAASSAGQWAGDESPCHRASPTRRNALLLEDPSNRRPAHTVAEVLEGALDSGRAPRRVLDGHPPDQRPNGGLDTRTAGSPSWRRTSAGRQLAVPAENRICRDDGRHLRQCGTSHWRPSTARRRRSSSLSCRRRPRRCARNTRFSSRRNAITSSCSRRIQPQRVRRPQDRRHRRILRQPVGSSFGTVRAEPSAGSDSAVDRAPLTTVDGENSREKAQNVREDSGRPFEHSGARHRTPSAILSQSSG